LFALLTTHCHAHHLKGSYFELRRLYSPAACFTLQDQPMSRSSRSVAVPEVDDLWKLATTQREETEAIRPNKVGNETFTLFVGQKQAGKSSLITAFHNPAKDDAPKPTVRAIDICLDWTWGCAILNVCVFDCL